MTTNGWLQIGVFLAGDPGGDAAARPVHDAGVQPRAHLARSRARPLERLIYRVTGVDETREMRWTEYAFAMLRSASSRCWCCILMQRMQQWLPWNPQGFAAVRRGLAFNTAASFTTNTNWQAYSGESTMSYLTQMAGTGLPQLRLGGDRHRARGRLHPRHRAAREGHARQLLGRPGPLHAVGAAALLRRRRAVPGVAGRRPEPASLRCRDDGRGREADDRAGTRSRRRKSSRSSAPTAAASSTPTARIPSRTRRRCRTSSRCSASSRSRQD